MKGFNFFLETDVRFGWGRLSELGEATAGFGRRCLLVTTPPSQWNVQIYDRAKESLESAGIKVFHFDAVVTNPTTDVVDAGVDMAKGCDVDVIVGLGGGSSMDTAKAVAVGATHEGEAWDYKLFSDKQITSRTLPVITVTTTSGTGSQVTPVSVITHTESKCKSALVNRRLCPKVSIVDPELMTTVSSRVTASTGFDVFAHAFESYIHRDASRYTDLLAVDAIRLVCTYLPIAIKNGLDREARTQLAWADTLAGMCISNAGTTLPHSIGMAIGGNAPHVAHGEALAAIYPEFASYTYFHAIDRFAAIGRIVQPSLQHESDEFAAKHFSNAIEMFLERINLNLTLKDLGVRQSELATIADDSIELPDYTVNPRVASRDEILALLVRS